MQTLKTLRAFVAYPDGFTRTEYAADQVIILSDDAAKSYISAGHCAPHIEEAAKAETVNPNDFKSLADLKDALGAANLKEVGEAVEAIGHELENHKGATLIPLAIFETLVNKQKTAIADAKAAEEKAAADAKEQAESDAKAKETEAAVAEKQAADQKRIDDEKAAADEAAKAETNEANPPKADGTNEAKE